MYELISTLPRYFEKIIEKTKEEKTGDIVHYYKHFLEFVTQETIDYKICPQLDFILTTEFNGSDVPVVDGSINPTESTTPKEINWDISVDDATPVEINWDISVDTPSEVPVDIEPVEIKEINWDIDAADQWEIDVQDTGDQVQDVYEAPSVSVLSDSSSSSTYLGDSNNRNLFLDDLMEVSSCYFVLLCSSPSFSNPIFFNSYNHFWKGD